MLWRRLTVPLVGLLAMIMVGGFPALAAADDTVAFTIKDRRITESSGLATDVGNRRYWTVNDSGDSGVAYAIGTDGDVLGTVRFAADVQDVEAVAMRNNRIFIADIGDNDEERDFVTVYAIEDPDPGDDQRQYNAYDFSYPDGAHDAEGFFLDDAGRMYIVTKEAKGAIYAAPAEPARDRVNELEKVADAPAYATDATFLPDDDAIAIRTYLSVELLDAQSFDVDARVSVPLQPQGESITAGLDDNTLLLGSEGKNSKVYSIPVPTKVEKAPSGSASPPGTATPGPTRTPAPSRTPAASPSPTATSSAATGDGSDDDDTAPAPDNSGTMLALGLAAVVGLVAGVVVVVVRKRP